MLYKIINTINFLQLVLNFAQHLLVLQYSKPLRQFFFPFDLQILNSNTSLLILNHTSLQAIVKIHHSLPSFHLMLHSMVCTCSLLHSCNKLLHHITTIGLTFAKAVAQLPAYSMICQFTTYLFEMSECLGFMAIPQFAPIGFKY